MAPVVLFQSFRIAKMAPSRGAGHASFDATFEMDSGDEFNGVFAKIVELAVTVYPGMFTDTNCRRRSHHEVDICDFENMDTASSDDETHIFDLDILDVVAELPPKNQWIEHLVVYPVIAFIDAANVNRLLNNTVMSRLFNDNKTKSELKKDGGCRQKATRLKKLPLVSNTFKYYFMTTKHFLFWIFVSCQFLYTLLFFMWLSCTCICFCE